MSSGWEVYSILFFAGVLFLFLPLSLKGIAHYLLPRGRGPAAKPLPIELPHPIQDAGERTEDRLRLNNRFFLAMSAALLLLALGLILVPTVVALKPLEHESKEVQIRGLAAALSLCGFLGLALFYSVRKGDLSWLRSYKRGRSNGGAER